MHSFDQRTLGIIMLLLLCMLVVAKRVTTGSVLDKAHGGLLLWIIHLFNLFNLLIVNPLAAILLVIRHPEVDPTSLDIGAPLAMGMQIGGLVLYFLGYILMAWALATMRKNYQVGGSAPRAENTLVVAGPYRFIRHPMYTAALGISLGLALVMHSLFYAALFCIYLVLILLLIPAEEDGLRHAYGDQYLAYRQHTRRLL